MLNNRIISPMPAFFPASLSFANRADRSIWAALLAFSERPNSADSSWTKAEDSDSFDFSSCRGLMGFASRRIAELANCRVVMPTAFRPSGRRSCAGDVALIR